MWSFSSPDYLCEHKRYCQSNFKRKNCCACADERPHSLSAFLPRGIYRWSGYCASCRRFWERQIELAGITPSESRIPHVPKPILESPAFFGIGSSAVAAERQTPALTTLFPGIGSTAAVVERQTPVPTTWRERLFGASMGNAPTIQPLNNTFYSSSPSNRDGGLQDSLGRDSRNVNRSFYGSSSPDGGGPGAWAPRHRIPIETDSEDELGSAFPSLGLSPTGAGRNPPPQPSLDLRRIAEDVSIILEYFSKTEPSDDKEVNDQYKNIIENAFEGISKIRREYQLMSDSKGKGVELPALGVDDDMKTDSGCIICFSQIADTVLIPCNHLVLCMSCCEGIGIRGEDSPLRPGTVACPICRTPVCSRIKIFRG